MGGSLPHGTDTKTAHLLTSAQPWRFTEWGIDAFRSRRLPMRARLIILVIAILAVAGFAALNWSEVMRTSPLNFGLFVTDAALGAILLSLLALGLVAFLLSST